MNKLVAYLQLMRFHRPIGFLLLLWPTLWALWTADYSQPPLFILFIFSLGVIVMRSAGCIINDIADRNFDGKVVRTQARPLVTGAVTIKEAWILLIMLCLLAFVLVLFLHPITILLSGVGFLLALCYPLTKRFFPMPQFVLGLAFAWSIPMVFVELTQHLPLPAWILFLATVCWTMAYDTQYALADRPDDIELGLRSSAILFGRYERLWIGIFQLLMVLLLSIVGFLLHKALFFYILLLAVMGFALYQQCLISTLDRRQCIRAFTNNHWVGAVVFLAIVLG
ncbi:MAG: 4-hydroxybenzoate polyprenyltransferase [Gammaproteobacteria bacterium RIFCSPHIGHO2_12_FULL_41_15]|nr:MAG: 4-hydroxybenzoate polyprenyltransferase [Gammaproteobacteria bacterium RIFCSPHIGHO2_12_FULL_41_15]